MESENPNYCLKTWQFTMCLRDDGVEFTYKPLLTKAMSKVIPYSDIREVWLFPKWFPSSLRLFVKDDSKIYFFAGGNEQFADFKHNQITFNPLKRKTWEKMAADIQSRIPRAKPVS